VQEVVDLPLLHRLRGTGISLAPYVMVTAFFTALYMMIPHARAVACGAHRGTGGGILWAAVGKMFTAFVMYSTPSPSCTRDSRSWWRAAVDVFRLADPARRCATVVLVQTPRTCVWAWQAATLERGLEQLALRLMYFVAARMSPADRAGSVNRLATELGLPGIAVAQMAATLERAGLLIVTDNDELVPARDIGRIGVYEILDIARNQGSGHVAPRNLPIPPVDRLLPVSRMRAAIAAASSRYATWVDEAARPALQLTPRQSSSR